MARFVYSSSAFLILLLFWAGTLVDAHAQVFEISIDGVDQVYGIDTYIRSPPNNNPVKDLTSSDVACNVDNTVVPTTLTVEPGDTVTFIWGHDRMNDDIIASSHKGPVVVYIAPTSSNGAGDVWVKIAEEGYTNGVWATEKLIANAGRHSIIMPNLEPGEYLLRPEILALHEADSIYTENPNRGIQLYMECIQVEIRVTTGALSLPTGVSFPGAYKYTDPGIHFDIYNLDPNTYQIPGPEVWDPDTTPAASSSLPNSSIATSRTSAVQSSSSATSSSALSFSTLSSATLSSGTSSSSECATLLSISTITATVTFSITTATTKTVTVTSASAASTVTVTHIVTTGGGACQTNSPTGLPLYSQCGGINYSGETVCKVGSCQYLNDYYYQCLL